VEEAPDPLLSAPTDPLTFAFEDSIVLILKPREFYRKFLRIRPPFILRLIILSYHFFFALFQKEDGDDQGWSR
jgi:hypothetical protein